MLWNNHLLKTQNWQ